MTPYGIALTSHIIVIILISFTLCSSIFIVGLKFHGLKFLKIFIPECPLAMLPFLIIIEIFSYIIRAFSLAIRLSANIMSGHTLVFIISSALLKILLVKVFFFLIPCVALLAILLLEFGVSFLQAYVFVILVSIYLSDAYVGPAH